MNAKLQKDESIVRLLAALKERLGVGAFDVVDHWDEDLCAIGIARRDNHGILAYISTFGQAEGTYFVSLEMPPRPPDKQWANHPYTPAGECEARSFDQLVEIIQKHLSL